MVLFGPAGMSVSDSPPSVTSVSEKTSGAGQGRHYYAPVRPSLVYIWLGGYPLGTPLAVEVYINVPPIQRRVFNTNISI